MRSVIITESYFGNTAAIAEEIAAGLTDAGTDTTVTTAEDALNEHATEGTDLVILAAPTHNMGLPSATTRRQASDKGAENSPATGIREWIDDLSRSVGGPGTRIIAVATTTGGFMAGSASKAVVKALKKKGVTATRGEDFTVAGVPGPLAEGEKERARAWAQTLVS